MRNVAVILAGGVGTRMGGTMPKQFFKVSGKTVLEHTISVFDNHPLIDEIAIVVHPNYLEKVEELCCINNFKKVGRILLGGSERYYSSLSAINAYASTENDINLIFHDSVRPLVNKRIITYFITMLGKYGAVDVAIPATDTIINQRGKDVICIYVAIGQKASTVAKIVNTLKKHDAMDYSIVVSSTASDPASLQYIAPYAGTAMAEYFMHKGKDVLIVYDDLSKHAVAYRAISLLLERSPGREAYPGDVFYLHSRLLERSSHLSDKLGGGSITALPIIETQAGDVSAYIPTNVISITDGQIFLESNLFNAGMRPAVNVGLSVSRVGGAAQTKAMKKASGSIRIDLAQYREMEVFTQFASDLDDATKAQLQHGKALMELLKQPLSHPLSMHEQVLTLCMATDGVFDKIPTRQVKQYQKDILDFMDLKHPEIGKEIEQTKALSDELRQKIKDAAAEFAAEQ